MRDSISAPGYTVERVQPRTATANELYAEPPQEPEGIDFSHVGETTKAAPPIRRKTLGDFLAEYEPIHYRVEPIIRSSALYTLTGSTGAGKTAFLTILTLCVAAGRGDPIGMEVEQSRVLYLAFENPDDVRMRFLVAAYWLNFDLREIANAIEIIDVRGKPETILASLQADQAEFGIIVVDTLQAAYDGKDSNDNVATGEFMRRLRPLSQLPGRPAVVVAAHPVKGATENNLIPYGGGAILNEIDGNLTLWKNKANGLVTLHHQGKFRGLEFSPKLFKFETAMNPDMLDAKGRTVELPILRPTTEAEAEQRDEAAASRPFKLLCAMYDKPAASYAQWAVAIGLKSSAKSTVFRLLDDLKSEKLVKKAAGDWSITAAGKAVVEERRPTLIREAE